jgi:hypothetical protein
VVLASAAGVVEAFGVVGHAVVEIDLRRFGRPALTADIPVPKGRSSGAMGEGIPVTYVSARNHGLSVFSLGLGRPRLGVRFHRRERAGLIGLSGLPARLCRCFRAHGKFLRPLQASMGVKGLGFMYH